MRLVIVNINHIFCKNVSHQNFFHVDNNVGGLVSTVRQIGHMCRFNREKGT